MTQYETKQQSVFPLKKVHNVEISDLTVSAILKLGKYPLALITLSSLIIFT